MKIAQALKWSSAQKLFWDLMFDTKKVNMKSAEAASSSTLMTFTGPVSNVELVRNNALSES